jgi:hypothetical protein
MKPANQMTLFPILTIVSALFASSLWAKDTLQIDKAFVGTTDSWRDVTMYLQDQIESGVVSVTIAQPFTSIGGDPAPGKVKNLIVDYNLNGKPYRLCLKEQYPVAFTVNIPSTEAEGPGANPLATDMMENISSSSTSHVWTLRQHEKLILYAAACMSLAALVCAGFALFQVRQIRKEANVPPAAR